MERCGGKPLHDHQTNSSARAFLWLEVFQEKSGLLPIIPIHTSHLNLTAKELLAMFHNFEDL